ncbi:hypothetical protein [Microcoleus sp. FACHB-672]|uniref:hypothetical protein n=1 Tax=Microcoleus sp. FACHB-672 TaxID=2692825 RepID=UPI001686F115|nr:hypothetical protein [Microcoleus sp. FACHB-672]MBD2039960.1 hypothetical protein [Microcoleus sp. FACHB-672]
MNYPIPSNQQEIVAMQTEPVDEELVAAAIAGVIKITRSEGRSLDQLMAEVLADDNLLDKVQRRWLSDVVAQAWECLT